MRWFSCLAQHGAEVLLETRQLYAARCALQPELCHVLAKKFVGHRRRQGRNVKRETLSAKGRSTFDDPYDDSGAWDIENAPGALAHGSAGGGRNYRHLMMGRTLRTDRRCARAMRVHEPCNATVRARRPQSAAYGRCTETAQAARYIIGPTGHRLFGLSPSVRSKPHRRHRIGACID